MKRKTTTTMRTKKKLKGYPADMMVMELDPDILLEIFSLLPFKKAVQCRYVCKSWRTLLDDDFLINIYAKTKLKLDGYDHHHAHSSSSSSSSSIVSFIYYSYLKDASLFGLFDDNLCSYKESRFKLFNDSSSELLKDATMINSCNGLICLKIDYEYLRQSIAIYNPVTAEFLRLPWDFGYRYGGFGYHPSTKEYKILRTIRSTPSYCHQIYTLGTTGRWEDIKGSSGRYNNYDVPGVHVNGALYWITGTGGNLIMSFDLADQEFRTLTMLPPLFNNVKPKPLYKLKLVESQGCLFLFVDQYYSPDDQHIELWVLKKKDLGCDHGFRYYWSNVKEISTVGHREKGDYEFLALTQSGKFLFRHKSVLTCFDPKTERFASISYVPSPGRYKQKEFVMVPHTNSLVSFIALGAIPKKKKKIRRNFFALGGAIKKKKKKIIRKSSIRVMHEHS